MSSKFNYNYERLFYDYFPYSFPLFRIVSIQSLPCQSIMI